MTTKTMVGLDHTSISTQTVVAACNFVIDRNELSALYEKMQPDSTLVVIKLGARVKKLSPPADKLGKRADKPGFRNALTLVLRCGGKFVNVKVCVSGKLQITGCKGLDTAHEAVKTMWSYLAHYIPYPTPGPFRCDMWPVMTNFDLRVDFQINRRRMDEILYKNKVMSMIETSFGYPGIICKMPVDESAACVPVDTLLLHEEKDTWTVTRAYQPAGPNKHTTFMIFQSGSVIASGLCESTVRPHAEILHELMYTNREYLLTGQ
jgi:TATA-box binding protein (TBP) (component of TFIID and TFIIIB)